MLLHTPNLFVFSYFCSFFVFAFVLMMNVEEEAVPLNLVCVPRFDVVNVPLKVVVYNLTPYGP